MAAQRRAVATAARAPAAASAGGKYPFPVEQVRQATLQYMTCVFYGRPKVGKTTLAATFPAPWILAVREERGTVGLAQLTKILGVPIEELDIDVTQFSTQEELEQILAYAPRYIAERQRKTVVLDTGTTYGTLLTDAASRHGTADMDWGKWRAIKGHFINFMNVFGSSAVHLCFLLHVDERKNKAGGLVRYEPKLVGSALDHILSVANLIGYLDVIDDVEADGDGRRSRAVHRLWMRCPEEIEPQFTAGGHFENYFDEPVLFNATFRDLAERMEGVVAV